MLKKSFFLLVAMHLGVIASFCVIQLAHADDAAYHEREPVLQFVSEMVEKHGFVRDDLLNLFANAEYQASVVKAMDPPSQPGVRSWQRYRPRFINSIRIARGQKFMTQYAADLKRAREIYGVPEEIITAIIGVETVYGQNTGRYRILDALTTLAFDYPRRAEYFRQELAHFLQLAREQNISYYAVLGSYAGAIGLPQFMPSNVRQLAVDFDGDGKVDLRNSPVDAIGSVARYLQFHGWQANSAVAVAINFQDAVPEAWTQSILPALTVDDFKSLRYSTQQGFDEKLSFALIPLETPNQATDYWLGFNNFYVITRYNQSSFYAMSVFQLAQSLKHE